MRFSRQEYWSGVPLPYPHFHVSNVHSKYKILSIKNHTPVCGSKSFLTTSRLCCCHSFYFITNHLILSSCLQFCPPSGSFPMSRLLTSGGQSIGASASASVLPMNIQGQFPLGLTGLVSSLSRGLSFRLKRRKKSRGKAREL